MTFTGYIYKITGACGLVYIGSTTDIIRRKWKHNSKWNTSSSRLIKKPLQFDIIDTREYKLMKTLYLVEQFYLDNNNTINQKRAYINYKNLAYLKRRKQKLNQYYYNNKETMNKNNRENYHKNREKILENNNVKIICECGLLSSRKNLLRHKTTKKHLKLMNLL